MGGWGKRICYDLLRKIAWVGGVEGEVLRNGMSNIPNGNYFLDFQKILKYVTSKLKLFVFVTLVAFFNVQTNHLWHYFLKQFLYIALRYLSISVNVKYANICLKISTELEPLKTIKFISNLFLYFSLVLLPYKNFLPYAVIHGPGRLLISN